MDPGRRGEKKVELQKGLDLLDSFARKWSGYLEVVNRAGPYYQPPVIKMQDDDRQAIIAHLKLFELEEKCLRAGTQWTAQEREPKPPIKGDRANFKAKFLDKLIESYNEMPGVWDEVKYEVDKPPKDRVDKLVAAARKKGQTQREHASDLAENLDAAGPYGDDELENLRKAARDAQREAVKLLEMADRCLRDGEPWSGKDQEQKEKKLRQDMAEALRNIGWIE
jgi:hypothetical protein